MILINKNFNFLEKTLFKPIHIFNQIIIKKPKIRKTRIRILLQIHNWLVRKAKRV